jgi:hypothetical protein
MRKLAAIAVAILLAGTIAVEFAARTFIGFPLIYLPHATLEYLPAPNQQGRHRGMPYATNQWGMRTALIAEDTAEDAFRVAVFGDSIVFGHTITPQEDLATTRLSALAMPDDRRIEALNIAANSWGPGNQLAFIESYGLFDADAAVLVIATHDLSDDRAFDPLAMNVMPTSRMPMALLDWSTRREGRLVEIQGAPTEDMTGDARRSLPALLGRLRAADDGACILLHETRSERLASEPSAAVQEITALAAGYGIPLVRTRDHIDPSAFADDIHPTPKGQRGLLAAMLACPSLAGVSPQPGG